MMTSFVTWRFGTTPYPDADLYFTKRANSWKSQNSLALWFSCDGFCYNFANIATPVWRLSSNGMPISTNDVISASISAGAECPPALRIPPASERSRT
jgi:hypothetical protein